MTSEKKKGKISERKEITIILKSKPKGSNPTISAQFIKSKRKPRYMRQKGTRGPSWIG